MTKDFYNTTGETGDQLGEFTSAAIRQQVTIQGYAKTHREPFTREDLRPLFPPSTPVTSIVRALCNLRDLGEIRVVGKTLGPSKRPIFISQYVRRTQQLRLEEDAVCH